MRGESSSGGGGNECEDDKGDSLKVPCDSESATAAAHKQASGGSNIVRGGQQQWIIHTPNKIN